MTINPLNLDQLVANTRGDVYEFRTNSQTNATAVHDH